MLMVRPHEKNDQDGLSLETLVSSIALSPIVGRKRPDRCRRASRRSDATATPTERRKAAAEAAQFLLPKNPEPKKLRRRKFLADEYGFSVDPNLARELRDAKLQLGCLRLSSRKLTPYAMAKKASKLQARIKEIQESLQCPCPSKYSLTYTVDGAEVPGEIVRDNERLTILMKRHARRRRLPQRRIWKKLSVWRGMTAF